MCEWAAAAAAAAAVGLVSAVIIAASLWTFSQRIIVSAAKKMQKSKHPLCSCSETVRFSGGILSTHTK